MDKENISRADIERELLSNGYDKSFLLGLDDNSLKKLYFSEYDS